MGVKVNDGNVKRRETPNGGDKPTPRGRLYALRFLCGLILLPACSHESFDTGDGTYSHLRTDFATVYTDGGGRAARAKTDDGDSLVFTTPLQTDWTMTADTAYRALVYYDRRQAADEASHTSTLTVKPFSIGRVLVLRPSMAESENTPTDPLTFESAWASPNGRYLNLGLAVKTGSTGQMDARQSLGVAAVGVTQNATGGNTHTLQLVHAQNGIPEYYSVKVYASIPLDAYAKGDSVRIVVNSYKGVVTKAFGM